MPKKVSLYDLVITTKPTIEAISHNHKENCKYRTHDDARCRCVKYFQIRAGVGECYRISSGTLTGWKEARDRAAELVVELDPETRKKQAAVAKRARITPKELFDLYIDSKENGQDAKIIDVYGKSPSIKKVKTLKRILCGDEKQPEKTPGFLAQWNALPRDKKLVELNQTIDKIEYVDQITKYWLEHAWRPTWFGGNGKGSFWSKVKRLEMISAIWHFGIRNGYIHEKHSEKNCQCTACKMMKPKKTTKTVKPTPPFELSQYEQILDSCALFEASYRDFNTEQLRITNEHLRAIIEVMRHCGPRVSDASLMRRDDIDILPNGKAYWTYVPLKNGNEGKPVTISVPQRVLKQLLALPKNAPGYDPDYFFWTGKSTLREAADPWQRALLRLWTLCPEEAKKVKDPRNKQKLNPSSHMFRNTFCVQCRLKAGMTYAEIAVAIGDTEEMVKDHYSAYCREYDRMIADKAGSWESRIERMQNEDVVATELLHAEAAALPVDVLKERGQGVVVSAQASA